VLSINWNINSKILLNQLGLHNLMHIIN